MLQGLNHVPIMLASWLSQAYLLKFEPGAKNDGHSIWKGYAKIKCLVGLGCRPFRLQVSCSCSADTAM